MKKVVIAGSAKLQDDMDNLMQKFTVKKYEILDYPRPIEKHLD